VRSLSAIIMQSDPIFRSAVLIAASEPQFNNTDSRAHTETHKSLATSVPAPIPTAATTTTPTATTMEEERGTTLAAERLGVRTWTLALLDPELLYAFDDYRSSASLEEIRFALVRDRALYSEEMRAEILATDWGHAMAGEVEGGDDEEEEGEGEGEGEDEGSDDEMEDEEVEFGWGATSDDQHSDDDDDLGGGGPIAAVDPIDAILSGTELTYEAALLLQLEHAVVIVDMSGSPTLVQWRR
jgi:hypothetical protein